ncbi:MAG TPA: hypothetical protein PKE27_15965 [Povalibacter sp.]|uniref:hypothetical protein n=1 Tax=Povalibacter sp. TaxID=1962978 RepID=UPI002C7D7B1C|nr:hypothetical protein [Povalibacter sp.]HMN46074.1 hypothetical protein [Povalibacter sp.]
MDRQQAEAAGDALLAPRIDDQRRALEQWVERQKQRRKHQKRGAWALAGFMCGAAAGLFATGNIWPAALAGLFIGALAGVLVVKE